MLQEQTDKLIEEIKSHEVYLNYLRCKEEIKKYPDKFNKANLFRKEMFSFQNASGSDFDRQTQLNDEKKKMYEDLVIRKFLEAELELCRLMQKIDYKLITSLDFELGF